MNVEVNKNAKAYSRAEIVINAPVEKVYKIVTNIPEWVNWQSAVNSAKLHSAFAEGSRFTWKANGVTIRSKIHTVTKNTEIGWTGKIAWVSAVHNWYFSAEENGTRVEVEESLRGLGSRLISKSLAEGMIQNLNELKEFAEREE